MDETWIRLSDFSDYSISSKGRVRHDEKGRLMALTVNQRGIMMVGLTVRGVQYRRSVVVLVANHFLDAHSNPRFDTPIQLDGDRTNAEVENLAYRPLWFAKRYHQQFRESPKGIRSPVRNLSTGETFPTSWEASITYGLIDVDLMLATLNKTYVFPTFHLYERV